MALTPILPPILPSLLPCSPLSRPHPPYLHSFQPFPLPLLPRLPHLSLLLPSLPFFTLSSFTFLGPNFTSSATPTQTYPPAASRSWTSPPVFGPPRHPCSPPGNSLPPPSLLAVSTSSMAGSPPRSRLGPNPQSHFRRQVDSFPAPPTHLKDKWVQRSTASMGSSSSSLTPLLGIRIRSQEDGVVSRAEKKLDLGWVERRAAMVSGVLYTSVVVGEGGDEEGLRQTTSK